MLNPTFNIARISKISINLETNSEEFISIRKTSWFLFTTNRYFVAAYPAGQAGASFMFP